MKLSGGVEWALHCCVVLTAAAEPVPAARLAQLHDVSPSYLAKQMQALSRAGLVRSVQGKTGGYVLTRGGTEITVLDVVQAVDGASPAFTCTEIRQRGPFGTPPEKCAEPCPIARVMSAADAAWRASLQAVSIGDLAATVERTSGPDALPTIGAWLNSAAAAG
ncbi:Rrf2 family transcriptional regulator [Streptomyces alfalfae]|uniref:Rrf2 family transcriptional regulator n=1 Tax=Streptomyces alfalfae TaxID=1642299 RepID=A0A1P8TQA4_9ACTN|nr:Rrf2 family transcriptional regulator [Streptomyces alfalfae]AYA20273.1 Rrf2 family transcriptional regulator [Streptomyces fradiae]APY89817.1 Rrf2 family transcriptional regulator [Streptomyces alfalfae]QQC87692.1 Rrf2 family transcriptional regulator [Streptomyces alfalfae]QUI30123.1 Rrf2 family transcriptional regulator [Streptomyces alfalfae]RXX42638.1 Rrf2 family transcriptional regulator [Streptomyces alfalfae]